MDVDIDQILEDHIKDLNQIVDKVFGFPPSTFKEHGTAALAVAIAARASEVLVADGALAYTERASASLDTLCESVKWAPKAAVESISMAYSAVSLCRDESLALDAQEIARVLMVSSFASGLALGAISKDSQGGEAADAIRRSFLSMAGALGGKAKSVQFDPLRKWALQEAAGMKGADKGIARALARRLPNELVDVSADPERLIYDALRARRAERLRNG